MNAGQPIHRIEIRGTRIGTQGPSAELLGSVCLCVWIPVVGLILGMGGF